MGFDLPVFISAGIKDALSPMPLAIAGIYALIMLFLRQSRKPVVFVSAGLFIGVLLVLGAMLDLRFFDPLSVTPIFLDHSSWALLVLGSASLILGFFFLREWRIFIPAPSCKFAAFIPTPAMGWGTGLALSFFLAGWLAFLLNVWPVDYQVLIQSDMAFTPGRFYYSLGGIFVYEFFRNLPVLFVFLFFILACREGNAVFLRQRRPLMLVIASAFYVAVGGSLLFFFFVAATKQWL